MKWLPVPKQLAQITGGVALAFLLKSDEAFHLADRVRQAIPESLSPGTWEDPKTYLAIVGGAFIATGLWKLVAAPWLNDARPVDQARGSETDAGDPLPARIDQSQSPGAVTVTILTDNRSIVVSVEGSVPGPAAPPMSDRLSTNVTIHTRGRKVRNAA